jgi:hypothetical protein
MKKTHFVSMTIIETMFYTGLYAYVSIGFGYFLNKFLIKISDNYKDIEL